MVSKSDGSGLLPNNYWNYDLLFLQFFFKMKSYTKTTQFDELKKSGKNFKFTRKIVIPKKF